MLTPPGTSMTLASRRSEACSPPDGANWSISLPPIVSAVEIPLSVDTGALRRDHVDALRDGLNGQVERQIRRLSGGHHGVPAAGVEPSQRC